MRCEFVGGPDGSAVLAITKDFGHIGDGFYCGGTKWGQVVSCHENGDGHNKCIISRPHSCGEDVPRSITKTDKTGTGGRCFLMIYKNSSLNWRSMLHTFVVRSSQIRDER